MYLPLQLLCVWVCLYGAVLREKERETDNLHPFPFNHQGGVLEFIPAATIKIACLEQAPSPSPT